LEKKTPQNKPGIPYAIAPRKEEKLNKGPGRD